MKSKRIVHRTWEQRPMNIAELKLECVYEREELYALSDWFAEQPNVMFGSVLDDICFRAEPIGNPQMNEWIIKDIWYPEKKK